MNINDAQQQLFQLIKARVPSEASVADEVAKLLNISSDSAYRRLRAEKQITFEELYLLCNNYRISADQLMNIQTGAFMFQGNFLNPQTYRYDAYLTGVMHNMAYYASFNHKEFYYLCKDAPLFHHWICRDYAAFKYFVWMSTLIYFPEFRNRKIKLDEYTDDVWGIGQKILDYYSQLDVVEIWNLECLNSTLHQIQYFRDTNKFDSDKDVLRVYEAVEKYLDHIEEQAKLGYQFDINDPAKKRKGKYDMYFNEIIILDNSMIAVLDNAKMAVVPHTVINYMMTRDINFCEYHYQYVHNLMRRSTQISEVSEKERGRFFRLLRERIERRKAALQV